MRLQIDILEDDGSIPCGNCMEVLAKLFAKPRKVAAKRVANSSDGTGLTAWITDGSDGTEPMGQD